MIDQIRSASKSVGRVCDKCGSRLFAGALDGVCSVCLLKTCLGVLTESRPAGSVHAAGILSEFDDYELLEEIGRGGQGIVYRARQKSLDRTVALKIIGLSPTYLGATKAHLERFRLEAKAAASLNHPCIVPIYQIGERDGCCYFSMGLVEGHQLDEVIKSAKADSSHRTAGEREPMAFRRAAELIAKLARALHYAHEHGIVHRDIKPGNILLGEKGEPHLTDFGLARFVETESDVTRTAEVLGTPSYMAPEQAVGNNAAVSSATDVYGLGAVLYHLLTGQPPFAGGTTYETVRLVLDTEPRQPRLLNPKVDRDLSTICLKCLEKDPKRRYSSALALAEDLDRWLKHEPILARRSGVFTRGKKWARRNPSIAVMAAMLLALAVPLSVMIWKTGAERAGALNPVAPEKSIAVLPFRNLGTEPESAYFADGVQDQILTNLAQIADLKVISRTSVMQYNSGVARNLREVGRQLGVAHVLEGSVQRAGNKVRVNAELIDARTDAHLWAQTYDRDLSDIFAIQSEIAKAIAGQLQTKLSPNEKKAIEQPPTTDLAAFDLYSRAKSLLLTASFSGSNNQDVRKAIELLDEAVKHDPSFFDAYCQLAWAHEYLYAWRGDHTAARLALAEAALQSATRLRPDAGETHLARAQYLNFGRSDSAGALAELDIARRTLPNDPRIFELTGYILRRRGQQEEALHNLERAVELDPRNLFILPELSYSYANLRRHAEAIGALDRVLSIAPNNVQTRAYRAAMYLFWKADTRPLHQTIDAILAQEPDAITKVADFWYICALCERDSVAAERALVALDRNVVGDQTIILSRRFCEGMLARMTKDQARARAAFEAARAQQEKMVQAQPDHGPSLCVLAQIDAALGRKELALEEGRRAIALTPMEKDIYSASRVLQSFPITAAWAGDKELALQELETSLRAPVLAVWVDYGFLKLWPSWDSLRGDPRFEKIVASLAPK
jgi:serine/threonine protein kinase/tetratricopeptide (TPR) repeat protein